MGKRQALPPKPRLPPLLLLALLLLAVLGPGLAAAQPAPLRYAATLQPSGEARLDATLADTSRLLRLATEAPVDGFGLVARAEAEIPLLQEVLRAEGYWAGRVTVRIAGQDANAPALAERLEGSAEPVPVEIQVAPGPRYTMRRIALRPDDAADAAAVAALGAPPGLAVGDPAAAGPVLDAEAGLLDRLRRDGYPLAAIVDREVLVDHAAQAMDVTWTIAPGPAARFATPEVAGTDRVNQALLDRIAGRLTDQPYSPARLERTRRDLLALGAFDSVRARAGQRLDAAGRLPVTFAVADRPRNAFGVNLAYETNFGISGRIYFERRNVFGNAERLRLEAELSRIGESQGDGFGRVALSFRRPALFDGRTTLLAEIAGIRERTDAYDRNAFVASLLLERPFGEAWVLQAGPVFETGRIGRDDSLSPYTLAGLVMAARYDSTDSVLDPRRGIRLSLAATPYLGLQEESGGFLRAIGSLRSYFDITGDGRSVLALRGTLGSVLGAEGAVPLDKLFYAGGGGSVRGYGFQKIGPRDAQGRPLGGLSLVEGSVEWRQAVRGPFGLVAFVDAGSVGESETPDFRDIQLGVGLGLRYATGIGPLRLDVAVPLDQRSGDPAYGVYVGIGQAF
jgi:translocation and assembly module TamA